MSTQTGEPQKHFPQTSWTLLAAVQGEDDATVAAALEEFTRRYYRPIYAYLAAIIRDQDKTEELAQEFFATVILSGRLLARLDCNKGRFRPFLRQALRNYAVDAWRKQQRQGNRSPAEELRPDNWTEGWDRLALGTSPSPDAAFHATWVRTLLEEALARVRKICEFNGQTAHLDLFLRRYLSEASKPPSWKEPDRWTQIFT
jgi:DNA-directed RNA polymerase specialized sigma24 family protein